MTASVPVPRLHVYVRRLVAAGYKVQKMIVGAIMRLTQLKFLIFKDFFIMSSNSLNFGSDRMDITIFTVHSNSYSSQSIFTRHY